MGKEMDIQEIYNSIDNQCDLYSSMMGADEALCKQLLEQLNESLPYADEHYLDYYKKISDIVMHYTTRVLISSKGVKLEYHVKDDKIIVFASDLSQELKKICLDRLEKE